MNKAEKARNLRYRRPALAMIRRDSIVDELMEIAEECESLEYAIEDDEKLEEAFDGDSDEIHEFKMRFSDLTYRCDRLREALWENEVNEHFDDFFVVKKLKLDNTMMNQEVWKTIEGIPTHQVSNFGRVRSLPRKSIVIGKRHYVRNLPGKMLSLCESQRYTTVSINDHTYTVHRLVAEAFITNKNGKPHVNHINGNKHDNRAFNLEWATISENELHSYCCLGKRPWNYGKHYDTTNAVKARRENYYKKCESTLQEFQKSKQSVALFSASVGLSSRQVYERLKVAKAIRKEV